MGLVGIFVIIKTVDMKSAELKKFEEVVNDYQKTIINFHYRFIGDKFEAENLAQETFIKVYLKFQTLKDPKKMKSWIFSIARNVVIDFFRRNKNREIAFGNEIVANYIEATSADFGQQVDNDEISHELDKCIDQLSPQDKMMIKLLYYEGFSYNEISKLLKINQNTLKSRLHRARTILMEIVQGNEILKDAALQYK